MAIDEARRPRRIIEAAPARDAASPLLRLADRFQRALLPRGERAVLASARDDEDEVDEAPAGAGQGGAPAGPRAADEGAARRSDVVPAAAPQAPAALRWHPGLAYGGGEPPDAATMPDADGQADDDDGWQAELARWIAQLCNGADAGFEGWSITLPMKPGVLPQTTLRLELSPHWLALRFHTGSARALSLLSRHRTTLEALLRESLKGDLPIDIEIA